MVIAPGKLGASIVVILADGEFLPEKFNRESVMVFRRGESTDFNIVPVKALGKLADPGLLRPPVEPACNFAQLADPNPLHQHKDGTWWFYDETWAYESGPYADEAEGLLRLNKYCEEVLEGKKDLTNPENPDTLLE